VDDKEVLADLRESGAAEGLLMFPEGAACLAATRRLRECGWIDTGEEVVCSTPVPASSTRTSPDRPPRPRPDASARRRA
jgi:hypothetical protein